MGKTSPSWQKLKKERGESEMFHLETALGGNQEKKVPPEKKNFPRNYGSSPPRSGLLGKRKKEKNTHRTRPREIANPDKEKEAPLGRRKQSPKGAGQKRRKNSSMVSGQERRRTAVKTVKIRP